MKIIDIFKTGNAAAVFSEMIINNSKKSIFITFILMSFLIPGLFSLQKDFSHEMWFRESDPYLKNFKEFKKMFGSDDMAIIAIHSKKGIFNKETVKLLNELTDEMWQIPKIMRVESLANFKWVRAHEDDINIDDFLPYDLTEQEISGRFEAIKTMDNIKQYLISEDYKTFVIYAWPEPHFDEKPEYGPTVEAMEKLIEKYRTDSNYEFYIAGTVAMGDGLNTITMSDIKLIIPMVLFAITLMLIYLFRSFWGVVMPLALIAITVCSTLGGASWFGIKLNATTAMIPNILMAICIADSIHLILSFVHFRQDGLNKKDALCQALKKNIQPTLLTSISTSIGFFSLMFTELVPISDMGVLAGTGTLLAWVYSIFFICPLLMYLPLGIPKKRERIKINFLSKIFNPESFVRIINAHKIKIIIFFFTLTGVCIYSALQNEVNSATIDSFKDNVPIKKAYTFMRENIGGSYGVELVFDSGSEDGIKDPAFLRKVDNFQKWLKESKHITKVSSVVDVIKDVNKALNANDEKHYRIPDKRNAIAQELMLYSMGLPSGMGLNHWNSLDNRHIRVMIMWTLIGSKQTINEIDRIQKKIPEFGLKGQVAGTTALVAGLNDYIVQTFFKSMIMAILLVSLLMTLFFRSFKLGVLSMVPNVMPPLIGAGIMTMVGITINVGTILITSVCLGIAVDDTIYFLANYNRLTRDGVSSYDSVENIYQHTGSALIWTTVILVTGFGCFLFGSFIPNIHFGIMTALILSLALIIDLTLLPAILLAKNSAK